MLDTILLSSCFVQGNVKCVSSKNSTGHLQLQKQQIKYWAIIIFQLKFKRVALFLSTLYIRLIKHVVISAA